MTKNIDSSVSEIINSQYEENARALFDNPVQILRQQKSVITTNPLIIPQSNVITTTTTTTANSTENNHKFSEIIKHIASSFTGILDDILNKPENEFWNDYLPMIFYKDNRYQYLTILLIFITLYVLLIK